MGDRTWLRAARWPVLYAVALVAGRQLLLPGTELAVLWPAAGVAGLWTLARWDGAGRARQLATLGAWAAILNALVGVPVPTAVLFGVSNVCQGAGFAWLRSRAPRTGGATLDLVRLLLASLVASVLSAPAGVGAVVVGGAAPVWQLPATWVVRNTCGAFVVAATVVAWTVARGDGGRSPARWFSSRGRPSALAEYALALVVTGTATAVVFGPARELPLSFVVLATAVWVGSRFSPVVAATHSAVLAVAVVLATVAGHGPFGAALDPAERAVVVQLFVLLYVLVALLLAAGSRDRQRLLERALASEAEQAEQRATLDAVLGVMQDGLVVFDSDGRFLVRNAAAVQMAAVRDRHQGAAMRSPEGYGLLELDGSAIPPGCSPAASALAGERVVDRRLLRVEPETGRRSVLSVNAVPLDLAGPDGVVRRVAVMTLRDITEQQAQLRELEGFAGVVAHDLRNPLAAVLSWAEIADESLDRVPLEPSRTRAHLQRAYGAGRRAMDLLTELLQHAEAGDRPLEPVDVDLDEVVDEVAEAVGTGCPDLVLRRGPLGCVRGDATLLRQLVTNLVGNAAKYVAPGTSPVVEVCTRVDGDRVVLEVADNGIGMTPADRARAFESFFRGASGPAYAGTGLGLAICARVVERHGGDITLHANPATGGTLVRLDLPAVPADSADQGPRTSAS